MNFTPFEFFYLAMLLYLCVSKVRKKSHKK